MDRLCYSLSLQANRDPLYVVSVHPVDCGEMAFTLSSQSSSPYLTKSVVIDGKLTKASLLASLVPNVGSGFGTSGQATSICQSYQDADGKFYSVYHYPPLLTCSSKAVRIETVSLEGEPIKNGVRVFVNATEDFYELLIRTVAGLIEVRANAINQQQNLIAPSEETDPLGRKSRKARTRRLGDPDKVL